MPCRSGGKTESTSHNVKRKNRARGKEKKKDKNENREEKKENYERKERVSSKSMHQ